MFELNHVMDVTSSLTHSPHFCSQFSIVPFINTSLTSQTQQPCSPPPSTTSLPPAPPAATLVLWLAPSLWPLLPFSARIVALALRLTRLHPIALGLAKPWSGPSTSWTLPALEPMPSARAPSTRTWSRS
jgi:hypothetical protein